METGNHPRGVGGGGGAQRKIQTGSEGENARKQEKEVIYDFLS